MNPAPPVTSMVFFDTVFPPLSIQYSIVQQYTLLLLQICRTINGEGSMASSKEYLDYILEQLSGLDDVYMKLYFPQISKKDLNLLSIVIQPQCRNSD